MSRESLREAVEQAFRAQFRPEAGFDIPRLAMGFLTFDPEFGRQIWPAWLELDEEGRREFLDFTDRAGLTLYLWRVARNLGSAGDLPDRAAYEERLRKNQERLERRRSETADLLDLFRAAGLRCAVVKGFTLEPDFVESAAGRVQYDLDFYLSRADARAAYDLLRARGYEPLLAGHRGPVDHLPALVRKTGWEWRGDFFDVDIPAAVELHFQLWDSGFERIPLEFQPDPLERLVARQGVPTLDPQDHLAYCTLHMMRHLFRGSLRLAHLYEIACFLDAHNNDASFWREWEATRGEPMRNFCAAGFTLAALAFLCRLGQAEDEVRRTPLEAILWMVKFANTSLEPERSAKVEVLLQLSYVEGWKNRLAVLRQRLFPLALPGPVDAFRPAGKVPLARRLRGAARQTRMVASRAAFHAWALPVFLRHAIPWWWRRL